MTFRDEIRPVIAAVLENWGDMEAAKAEYCRKKGGYAKNTWDSEVRRQVNGWQPTQKKK